MLALIRFAPLTKQIIGQLDSLEENNILNFEVVQAIQMLPRRQIIEEEIWELEGSDISEYSFDQPEYPTVWKGTRNALRPCNLPRDI